jgi:hypothetical protein
VGGLVALGNWVHREFFKKAKNLPDVKKSGQTMVQEIEDEVEEGDEGSDNETVASAKL